MVALAPPLDWGFTAVVGPPGAVHAYVTISGANQAAYNGTFEVINNYPASPAEGGACLRFDYVMASDPGSDATGTLVMVSPWDGNADAYGYPALDQPGRGVGDLISGDKPGPQTWPHQALEPIYCWLNTKNGSSVGMASVSPLVVQENRDFYNGTAKPGYAAYTYPHPLAGGPTLPAAPTNVRIR